MTNQINQDHCPETECVFYSEEHCHYWQDGKCTITTDFLLITQPLWDEELSND